MTQEETNPRNGKRDLLILACAIGVFAVTALIMMPFTPDEAYISYRYAEHLADGKGLAFNVGERRVEGYANFLWVLICALVCKLGFALPKAMPCRQTGNPTQPVYSYRSASAG